MFRRCVWAIHASYPRFAFSEYLALRFPIIDVSEVCLVVSTGQTSAVADGAHFEASSRRDYFVLVRFTPTLGASVEIAPGFAARNPR